MFGPKACIHKMSWSLNTGYDAMTWPSDLDGTREVRWWKECAISAVSRHPVAGPKAGYVVQLGRRVWLQSQGRARVAHAPVA